MKFIRVLQLITTWSLEEDKARFKNNSHTRIQRLNLSADTCGIIRVVRSQPTYCISTAVCVYVCARRLFEWKAAIYRELTRDSRGFSRGSW